MNFSSVAHTFDTIESVSKRLEITRLLAGLFKTADGDEIEVIAHLSMGKLHPPYVGTQFNIAEKSMAPIIANLLDWQETQVMEEVKKSGDLGSVIAQGTWDCKEQLSVMEVFNWYIMPVVSE